MRKILIISNDKQESLLGFKSSEAFRIRSHCQSIFRGDEVYVFSENSTLKTRKENLIFIKDDFPSLLERLKKIDIVLLFQNSHFSSTTYKIARARLPVKKIVDLYNPLSFEKLTYEKSFSFRYKEIVDSINTIICSGDFFICANEKQYDYYLGFLSALGKIESNDRKLSPLAIIPTNMGSPKINLLRAKTKDFVFFGSIYPWFDVKTTLEFVQTIIKNNKNITFFGLKNPETKGIYQEKVEEIQKSLTKMNKNYIFFENWSDSDKLSEKLAKYKMAVSFVLPNSLEDEFAYRTRFLTLLANGIPILTNGQDQISREIIQNKAGCFYNKENNIDLLDQSEELKENCLKLYKKLVYIKKSEVDKIRNFIESPKNIKKLPSIYKFIQTLLYWFRKNFSGKW